MLYEKFMALGNALLNVVPKGVDNNYKRTFMQAMKQFGTQFLKEARNKKKEINGIILRAEILPGIYRVNSREIPFSLSWGK